MIKVTKFEEDKYLVMITKNGVIKRTSLTSFDSSRKGGLVALDLDEGDELSWVRLTDGTKNLLVATKKGKCIRFLETDIRAVGRSARGVRAVRLGENDSVVGMIVVDEDKNILTVSETGFGRLSSPDDYKIQSRSGKGILNYYTEKYGDVASINTVGEDDDVILISDNGVIIRIEGSSIRKCLRPSKGVVLMKVSNDFKVVATACVPHEEPDEKEETETKEEEQ